MPSGNIETKLFQIKKKKSLFGVKKIEDFSDSINITNLLLHLIFFSKTGMN